MWLPIVLIILSPATRLRNILLVLVLLFLCVGPMLVQVYLPLCPAVFFLFFSANKFDLI